MADNAMSAPPLYVPTDVEDTLWAIRNLPHGTVTVSERFLIDLCTRVIELEALTAPLRRHAEVVHDR